MISNCCGNHKEYGKGIKPNICPKCGMLCEFVGDPNDKWAGMLDPDRYDTVITHHVGVDKPRCLTEESEYRGTLVDDRRRGK